MTLRLLRWEPATAGALADLVRRLAPADGFVALGGPDGAALHDRVDAGGADGLAAAGDRWRWGRAFSRDREVLWRSEGEQALVVLALDRPDGDGLPGDLPGGWEACPGTDTWRPVDHDNEESARPGQLLLWHPDDLRLPYPPTLPESLRAAGPLAIQIQEYEGPDGVAWCRYLCVVPAGLEPEPEG
jgi:hypothetical protein